ncbi:MAG: Uma2 family endonuclease [Spirochaetaceae bacterium]|jgi:Uma2 family endonuclease|nr:Uma2 family endonuclease [Spirochaetaceae bacterium]
MSALPKVNGFFTYADYKNWELAEGDRYELLDGEAFAMAAPDAYHQAILTELVIQIGVYLRGKACKVYPAPYDVRPFYAEDESDNVVVQPDITVVCDEKKRGKAGCLGAPDLVVEVLSPSNSAIEMQRKFDIYRESGVREFWVVNPTYKTLSAYIFSNDTVLLRTYRQNDVVKPHIFPDLEIQLEPVFAE